MASNDPCLHGVRADQPQSYKSIERYAELVRSTLQLAPIDRIEPLPLFENYIGQLEIERSGDSIQLIEGVEERGAEALAEWDPDAKRIQILVSPETYQAVLDNRARAAYSLAHEIGHAVMHTDQLIRLAGMPIATRAALYRGQYGHRAFEDTEWQANAFASAFLMPADGIHALVERLGRMVTGEDISRRFGTSVQASAIRLGVFQQHFR